MRLIGSLIPLLGVPLFLAARVKAFQRLRCQSSTSRLAACRQPSSPRQGEGVATTEPMAVSKDVVGAVVSLYFVVDRVELVYVTPCSLTATSQLWTTLCGLVTTVAGLAIVLRQVANPVAWAEEFVGVKVRPLGPQNCFNTGRINVRRVRRHRSGESRTRKYRIRSFCRSLRKPSFQDQTSRLESSVWEISTSTVWSRRETIRSAL